MGSVVLFVLGLAPIVLALYRRHRRALAWIGAALALGLLTAVTVYTMPLILVLDVAVVVDAILVVRRGRGGAPWGWRWAAILFAARLVLAFLLGSYALEAFRIPSSSMCPTLQIGDRVMSEKLSLRWRAPARGDVVTFWAPDGRVHISRVIAIGGEVVRVEGGVVYVDGRALAQTRIGETTYANLPMEDDGGGWEDERVVEYDEDLGGTHHHVLRAADGDDARADFPRRRADLGPARCEDATPQRMAASPAVTSWPRMTTAPGGCRVPDGAVFVLGDNRGNSSDSRWWGPVPVERVFARIVGVWLPAAHDRAWGRFGGIR